MDALPEDGLPGPKMISLQDPGIKAAKRRARREHDRYGYRQRFRSYTTDELIEACNQQVGSPWWATARGYLLAALSDALVATDLDCSSFISASGMSLAERVERRGDAIVPISTPAAS